MNGQLYIDGIDAYAEWGVYVTSGGWASLVAWPPLKKVDSNDWQEDDGEEADLEAPVLDTRDLTAGFAVSPTLGREARDDRLAGFLDLISDGAYHEFDCPQIGRTYRLRLSSHPKLDYSARLSTFSLKLSDDFPLEGYEYAEPQSGMNPLGDYSIDGRDVAGYGVRVLRGSLSELVARPDVKPNMLRNIGTVAGAVYDPETVTLKTRDCKLTCLMRARSLEELWRNWDALLYDLARPGERTIGADRLSREYYGHYKSCSVSGFNPRGRIWLEFALTLTLTDGFRDELLASEDYILICTEDGEDFIDMHHAILTT